MRIELVEISLADVAIMIHIRVAESAASPTLGCV